MHQLPTDDLWAAPPRPLSSLDPLEITVHPVTRAPGGDTETPVALGVTFRHSGWLRDRQLICDALRRVGVPDARENRFRACGSYARVQRDAKDPDHLRITGSNCRDRFCKPCANARSRLIANNLRGFLTNPPYRFVTLTLKSVDEPLGELIDLLLQSFRKLRHLRWWRDRVTGGAGFVEVKYNPGKQRWHPHLHLILQGTYLDSVELRAHWWRITKHSFIVDVRAIPDVDTTLAYVTKYASKPLSNSFLNRPDQLDEAIVALSGRRLCHVFGAWQGLNLYANTDDTEWEDVCSLADFLATVAARVPWAVRLYQLQTGRLPDVTDVRARAPPATANT